MNSRPVILLTRPLAQSAEFRAMLGQGVETIISPVIVIKPVDFHVKAGGYDTIIFTSRNGVTAASRCMDLKGLRAIAVGDNTALAAKEFGMNTISSAGSSRQLIEKITQLPGPGKVLFVRGRHSLGNIENQLKSNGIDTDSVIAYEQEPQPLSVAARACLSGERPVILPLFSPRSARLVAADAASCSASAQLTLIGMSHAVLQAWDGPAPTATSVAEHPTAAAMAKETLRRLRQWP